MGRNNCKPILFALHIIFMLTVVPRTEIALALDDNEKQFLTDVGLPVCQDPTNFSSCKGLTLNKNEHITKMFVLGFSIPFPIFHLLFDTSHNLTINSDWTNMGLSSIPDSVGNLSFLKTLFVSSTPFWTFHTVLSTLTSFVDSSRKLDQNALTTLPETISSLSTLKSLFVHFFSKTATFFWALFFEKEKKCSQTLF